MAKKSATTKSTSTRSAKKRSAARVQKATPTKPSEAFLQEEYVDPRYRKDYENRSKSHPLYDVREYSIQDRDTIQLHMPSTT